MECVGIVCSVCVCEKRTPGRDFIINSYAGRQVTVGDFEKLWPHIAKVDLCNILSLTR